MNYEEKTVSERHIYKGNIINVDNLTVALPDGRHPGASVVVPLNEKGEVYMVRQFRKPIDAVTLEIPAGKLDPGEEPLVCAKRELKEETGLEAKEIRHLVSIHSTPGFSNEVLHMYSATGLSEGESCADEDEFISTEKYPVADLIDMILNGQITDAKTIIGVLLADKILSGKIDISYK
jgi:ADP-ribose pyrophosphatase